MTPEDFRCPVCRARQSPQTQCRRCGADLTMLLHALASLHAAQQELEEARSLNDHSREHQQQRYLNWLTGVKKRDGG